MRVMMAAVVVAVGCGVCRADLRGDFEKEYPAAVAKLEEGYQQVRMEIEHEFHYQIHTGGKEEMRLYHIEFLRDGEMYRVVMTTEKSSDERWPVGSVIVDGDTATERYSCYKLGVEGAYQFTTMEAKRGAPDMIAPAMAAYQVGYRSRLLELLKAGERDPVVVSRATFDGREAIDVISAVHYEQMKQNKVMVQHFYFEPGSWASMGCLMYRGPLTITRVVRYGEKREGEEIPRVKWIEGYEEDSRSPGARSDYFYYDVNSLEFEKAETGELELGALKKMGVEEVPTEEEVKAGVEAERKRAETQP